MRLATLRDYSSSSRRLLSRHAQDYAASWGMSTHAVWRQVPAVLLIVGLAGAACDDDRSPEPPSDSAVIGSIHRGRRHALRRRSRAEQSGSAVEPGVRAGRAAVHHRAAWTGAHCTEWRAAAASSADDRRRRGHWRGWRDGPGAPSQLQLEPVRLRRLHRAPDGRQRHGESRRPLSRGRQSARRTDGDSRQHSRRRTSTTADASSSGRTGSCI